MNLLASLGYGLDLKKCAATGTTENLFYISPKSGKAVCKEKGLKYDKKLLRFPTILKDVGKNYEFKRSDLLDGLKNIQNKYNIIWDVRGSGLFIGVELIKDMDNMIPAVEEADIVVNAMQKKGILISSDGSDHNVLKIKPPLVFNKKNANYFLESFEAIMPKNF